MTRSGIRPLPMRSPDTFRSVKRLRAGKSENEPASAHACFLDTPALTLAARQRFCGSTGQLDELRRLPRRLKFLLTGFASQVRRERVISKLAMKEAIKR